MSPKLSALRNFAAHESAKSKRAALAAIGGERIESSGAWLKRENRFQSIVDHLKALATDFEHAAPYWDAQCRDSLDHQGKFRREPMIFFRSSDRLGQAATRRAKIGSKSFCESPCESGLASG